MLGMGGLEPPRAQSTMRSMKLIAVVFFADLLGGSGCDDGHDDGCAGCDQQAKESY